MALKKLPKPEKVKTLELQDKLLEKLPDPKEEKRFLARTGEKLKRMIRHRSIRAKAEKIKKEEHEDIKLMKKTNKTRKKKPGTEI